MPDFEWINIDIVSRLVNRFNLATTTLVQKPFRLLRGVRPVTNFDELLQVISVEDSGEVSPTGTGWIQVNLVPTDERWEIIALDANVSTGTTERFTGISFSDGAVAIFKLATFGATVAHSEVFAQPVPLRKDWTVLIQISTHNAGDKVRLYLLVRKTKAYRD